MNASEEFRTAVVIGAGVMGGGIAAHLANAGLRVHLLDRPQADGGSIAARTLAALEKADPPAFMTRRAARRVVPGDTRADAARLAQADWIIEAVVEDPGVKREVFRLIETHRREGSVVSSNTSTIPLAFLMKDMPRRLARDAMITHFFNPPRYMRLLEVAAGPETRPEAVDTVCRFAEDRLGKGVVRVKDTPGFIANRIGVYWLALAVTKAIEMKIPVERADMLLGPAIGFPKTGVFGLLDLVGLDLMPLVLRSLLMQVPPDDPLRAIPAELPLIRRMLDEGYTGRKGKGGFYRRAPNAQGGRDKEALDLESGRYRPATRPPLPPGRGLAELAHADPYLAAVMIPTLAYAAELVFTIAETIEDVDRAMRLGYNWPAGPFQMIDAIGVDRFHDALNQAGIKPPPLIVRAKGKRLYDCDERGLLLFSPQGSHVPAPLRPREVMLADAKHRSAPIESNASAALWDLGDGVACLEIHTKLNTIDQAVLALLVETPRLLSERAFKALVIGHDGEPFSAGANIGLGLFAANVALWPAIEDMLRAGQDALSALRAAPFPVVGAPSGLALGGGCELLMACDAVQAHAETYMGLPEAGLGLLPAWGGCAALLHRLRLDPKRPKGPMAPVRAAFETIATARIARSAFEAKELGFLRPEDRITMNRAHVLHDAKARALEMADGYRPPKPPEDFPLPGASGMAALDLAAGEARKQGRATPHDMEVARRLARVLCGGDEADPTRPVAVADILALERSAFMELVRLPPTLARMEHMLTTGKPLRN